MAKKTDSPITSMYCTNKRSSTITKKGKKDDDTTTITKTCNRLNYTTRRNKREHPKLELKKYCRQCRKHTLHKGKDAK